MSHADDAKKWADSLDQFEAGEAFIEKFRERFPDFYGRFLELEGIRNDPNALPRMAGGYLVESGEQQTWINFLHFAAACFQKDAIRFEARLTELEQELADRPIRPPIDADAIRAAVAGGAKVAVVAREHGISRTTAHKILKANSSL